MLESINLISCNFSRLPPLKPSRPTQTLTQSPNLLLLQSRASSPFLKSNRFVCFQKYERRKDTFFNVCKSSLNNPEPEKTQIQDETRDWSSSILLFALWGAVLYYCFNLAPDQTPTQDLYFLKKLLNLEGDDCFRMNQILVRLWYIMGLWHTLASYRSNVLYIISMASSFIPFRELKSQSLAIFLKRN